MNGMGAPKRLPQMKMLRLCTVWSCVTGGDYHGWLFWGRSHSKRGILCRRTKVAASVRRGEENWLKAFYSCRIMHLLTCRKLLWLLWLNAASKSSLPSYSPDLTLFDFFLFPKLIANLHGRNFGSNEGVIDAVNWVLGGIRMKTSILKG